MKISTHLPRPGLRSLVIGLAAFTLAGYVAMATPYASELSISGGSVSFTLNESADHVQIIFGSTTTNLGPLAAGSYTTNVGASSPYSVKVLKNSGPGYRTTSDSDPTTANRLQISDDNNNFSKYANGRGLAVNKDPASPFFGRIYVSGSGGTTGGVLQVMGFTQSRPTSPIRRMHTATRLRTAL